MLRKLFSQRRARPGAPQGALPLGHRVYAIGDIHGRLDLLNRMLNEIEADDRRRGEANSMIIFLGDLIDRGPSSADVVERARQIAQQRACRFLLGNHEEVFLRALSGDLKALAFFTRIGGRETILSYGVSEEEYRESDYPDLLEMLRARVPAEHIAFLESFEDLIVLGDFAFVHAGVRPGESLMLQKPSDLRWIRHEFLDHRGALEKIIVHGHTVSEDIEERPNRIGLDTGAYASGLLTAMGFEADQRWAVQISL